jgi:hypothetical protein
MNEQLQEWLASAMSAMPDKASVLSPLLVDLTSNDPKEVEGAINTIKKLLGGELPDSYESFLGNLSGGESPTFLENPKAGPVMAESPGAPMVELAKEPVKSRGELLREKLGRPKEARANYEQKIAGLREAAGKYRGEKIGKRRTGRELGKSLTEPGGQRLFPFGAPTGKPPIPTPVSNYPTGGPGGSPGIPEVPGQMDFGGAYEKEEFARKILKDFKGQAHEAGIVGDFKGQFAKASEEIAGRVASKEGLVKRLLSSLKKNPGGAAVGAAGAAAMGLWLLNSANENRPENKFAGEVEDPYTGFKSEDILGEIETKQATNRLQERMMERDPDLYQVLANIMGGLPPRPEERSLFGRGGLTQNELYIGPQVSPDDIPDEIKAMLFQELGF